MAVSNHKVGARCSPVPSTQWESRGGYRAEIDRLMLVDGLWLLGSVLVIVLVTLVLAVLVGARF